jgi:hypothetical protein
MLKVAKLGTAIAAVLAWIVPAAYAGVPDATNSFYVPQTGTVATPTEGTNAARLFRMCPNNDGGTSLPNNSRVKVVVRDVNGNGIPGVPGADVCVLFNGGTAAQGFSGVGADSVISNSQWNPSPLCPDVRCVSADIPTDATGTTYITFTGSDGVTPGVGVRNPNRKWGHYDNDLPVYALGFKLSGRLTTGSANGTYVLRIKSFDWTGGLGALTNQGEAVTVTDFNGVSNTIGVNNAISYWKDFDFSGSVAVADLNLITNHLNHNCGTPNP